jgi:UDPglucose 6-dehydrogenase
MKVGFLGMSHLGQVYSTATAIRGASVVQFEVDAALLRELEQSGPTVIEPGLNEIWWESSANRKLTTDPELLRGCDLLFVVSDVLTDEEGKSDLHRVRQLTDLAVAYASSECPIVIRSQVPPGFTREYAQSGRQVFYQVETLVFSEAVTRAVNPDRHIIGVENLDLPLPEVFSDWLQLFPASSHVMSFESAELAKISINLFLAASVSTTNSLAELCESLGATWAEVVPALQEDPRIGKFAYLKPGLGISGGNLERDLVAHSEFRKGFVSQQLEKITVSRGKLIGMLGLSYKPGTASLKNSPSLDVLRNFSSQSFIVHDPSANVSGFPHVRQVETINEVITACETLLIMTPWPEYIYELNSNSGWLQAVSSIIDPYAVVSPQKLRDFAGTYRVLGSRARE